VENGTERLNDFHKVTQQSQESNPGSMAPECTILVTVMDSEVLWEKLLLFPSSVNSTMISGSHFIYSMTLPNKGSLK
jgi:hypothetical protein